MAALTLLVAGTLRHPAGAADDARLPVLTLEEARERALAASPDLAAAAAHARALEGALRQAGALPNPDLSFEAEDFGGNLPPETVSQRTLALSERIEWFGKRSVRLDAAREERNVAARDLDRRRLDLLLEVNRRFAMLLGAQERLGIAEENAGTAREVRRAVAALVSAGEASPIEEARAEGDEVLAAIERENASRDVALAARALGQLWGDASPSYARASGRLDGGAALPDRDAALAALARLPDQARWEAEVSRALAAETLARRQALPDITLSAGTRSFPGTGLQTWVAGVSIPVPILSTYSGARAEATARREQARAEGRAEASRLRTAWLAAEESLRRAVEEVRLLRDRVLPNARQVYEALNEGYRRGKFRLLDLLEARRSLAAARLREIDALTRLSIATAEVRRLTPDPSGPQQGAAR